MFKLRDKGDPPSQGDGSPKHCQVVLFSRDLLVRKIRRYKYYFCEFIWASLLVLVILNHHEMCNIFTLQSGVCIFVC